ncbi:hypothetical protein ASPVEDRAFT_84778 [Aspergillus versicolor CBS 583.65]|uniref:Uncharacterized protein n=1 Tax=Aspergillus versicolor CBS 583.65 TaxID=1036611 RepID=A0A1L9PP73_ASPVE|nr:uncharacterized protein ASPVEDRAFT_84778 [Aspergillus versicolor CBS 583.65]OJJ03328.1 hypothetical protein ASPVEDRAFT_84778 [Aspergillus versicolor CBS 583.65]
MSKFLDRIKHAMANSKSKSKRSSRGTDSWDYGGEYDSNNLSSSSHEQYRTNDYGTRFGSYGVKPRPGTYGSGDYGPNSRLGSYGTNTSTGSYYNEYDPVRNRRGYGIATNGYGYGSSSSATGAYGADTDVSARNGFGVTERGSGFQNGGTSSYGLEDRMESVPAYDEQHRWL